MWHRLKNFWVGVQTYDVLSPDLQVRQQVNRALRDRPTLTLHQWFQACCLPLGVTFSVAEFAYTHFKTYSGLEFSSVLASDRLEEDLYWTEVCWFDWELHLCDDFLARFGVDISDRLDELTPETVADLLLFLEHQASQDHPAR